MTSKLPPRRLDGLIDPRAERLAQGQFETVGSEQWRSSQYQITNALDTTGRIELRQRRAGGNGTGASGADGATDGAGAARVYTRGFWVCLVDAGAGYLLDWNDGGALYARQKNYSLVGTTYAVASYATSTNVDGGRTIYAQPRYWNDVWSVASGKLFLNASQKPDDKVLPLPKPARSWPLLLSQPRPYTSPPRYTYSATDGKVWVALAVPHPELKTLRGPARVLASKAGAVLHDEQVAAPFNYLTTNLSTQQRSDVSSAGYRRAGEAVFEFNGATLTFYSDMSESIIGISGRYASVTFDTIDQYLHFTQQGWSASMASATQLLPGTVATTTLPFELETDDVEYSLCAFNSTPIVYPYGEWDAGVRYLPNEGEPIYMNRQATDSQIVTTKATSASENSAAAPATLVLAMLGGAPVSKTVSASASYTLETESGNGRIWQYYAGSELDATAPMPRYIGGYYTLHDTFPPGADGAIIASSGVELIPVSAGSRYQVDTAPFIVPNPWNQYQTLEQLMKRLFDGTVSKRQLVSDSQVTTTLDGTIAPEATFERLEVEYSNRTLSGTRYWVGYSQPVTYGRLTQWYDIAGYYPIRWQVTNRPDVSDYLHPNPTFDEACLAVANEVKAHNIALMTSMRNVYGLQAFGVELHAATTGKTEQTLSKTLTVRTRDWIYYDAVEEVYLSMRSEITASWDATTCVAKRYHVWYELSGRGPNATIELFDADAGFAYPNQYEGWVYEMPVGTDPTINNNVPYLKSSGGLAIFAPAYCDQGCCPFIAYTTKAEEAAGAEPRFLIDMPLKPTTYLAYQPEEDRSPTEVQFVPHQLVYMYRKYLGGEDDYGMLTQNQNLLTTVFAPKVRLQYNGTTPGDWAATLGSPFNTQSVIHVGRS